MICLMHFTLEYLNSETASFPYEHLHEVDKARAGKGQRWGQRQRKCHTVLLLKAAGSIPAEEEEDWTGRTNVTCRYSRFGFIFSWIRGGKRNTFELLNNPSFKRESSHWDGETLKLLKLYFFRRRIKARDVRFLKYVQTELLFVSCTLTFQIPQNITENMTFVSSIINTLTNLMPHISHRVV